MSRTSSDEQLNFLLNCVKHSNNGKVDFTAVAEDCGIVTKGAAAKRYERMMKSHGINPSGGTASGQSPTESPSSAKGTPASKGKGTPSKKRKAAGTTAPSKKGKFKADPGTEDEVQTPSIKGEETENGQITGGGMYKSATNPDPMISGTAAEAAEKDAAALFNEFCHPIDSEAETSAKKAGRGTKRGAAAKKHEVSEAENDDADSVSLKEEPEIIG